MLREDVVKLIENSGENLVYIASSNRNIDVYASQIKSKNFIKIYDIQEKEEHDRVNLELLERIGKNEKLLVMLSLEGILQKYFLESRFFTLKVGENIKRKEFIRVLEESGFSKNYLVENRKEYSIRGDIIDFYPLNFLEPVRVEFFGDEIERITFFSVNEQKSLEKLETVSVVLKRNDNQNVSFLEILKKIQSVGKTKVYIENFEIFELKFEEAILREREFEAEYRVILEELKKIAELIEVKKSEGDSYIKKTIRNKGGVKYRDITEIKEGDFIIHENYGVGLYLGLNEIDGKEYLTIKYAGEDRLFVPLEGLKKIERYINHSEKEPELYGLGRKGFKKKKEKLEKDMLKFAKEIIAIQAKRELAKGYNFSPDTIWQQEFEEKFPFVETKDQRAAIEDVKRDMESSKVMDRIVCGDVGFGKTEVAIRAAFKAIMDGKQVMLIAPTTVLAQQHYQRVAERFKDYPINIELLSRLKTDKEQKEVLKKAFQGELDLLIGTHRLLSNDIKLKNLGLVIIDEEQKFGVKAKEKLKKIRNNVDMLTLTATPIPRTLNYALLGIRDISVIETAPDGRIPVEMKVIDSTDEEIKSAIMKEIMREGQVYYIYNRVIGMNDKLDELKKILPKFITIKAIHGKMAPEDIKKVLLEFEKGEIDILLSTTIIENGIDIENANTILIEKIDKLGLAQIYQLRGRVGRGNRKAYCYLVVEADKKMGKKATMRKELLEELKDIGGGFQLSLEDMRIRGAGEILGDKQHGAIETFGYNLYIKMLKEEIEREKGVFVSKIETKIKLKKSAYIPEEYIEGDERLKIYRRVLELEDIDEVLEFKRELRDRFGKIPLQTLELLRGVEIKIRAQKLKIVEIEELDEKQIVISFDNESMKFEKIMDIIGSRRGKYQKQNDNLLYSGTIEEFLLEYEN